MDSLQEIIYSPVVYYLITYVSFWTYARDIPGICLRMGRLGRKWGLRASVCMPPNYFLPPSPDTLPGSSPNMHHYSLPTTCPCYQLTNTKQSYPPPRMPQLSLFAFMLS